MRIEAASIRRPSSETAPFPSFAPSSIACEDPARAVDLGLARREDLVRELDLRGVDRPLALAAQRRRPARRRTVAVGVVEVAERAVDRAQALRAAGRHHAADAEVPLVAPVRLAGAVARAGPSAPSRRGSRRRCSSCAPGRSPRSRRRRTPSPPAGPGAPARSPRRWPCPRAVSIRMWIADAARVPALAPARSDRAAWRRTRHRTASRPWDQDGVEHVAGLLDDLDDVAVAPVGVEAVDANAHRARSTSPGPASASITFARAAILVVGRDRVLEVQEHEVGAERRRLLHGPHVRAGDGELAAVQPVLEGHGDQRGSTASNAAMTRSAVSRFAFTPIRPTRQIGGAVGPRPPPTSMPCSRRIRRLDVLAVHALRHVDRRQLPELMVRVGQERVAAVAHRRLEVPAGVLVARPPVLQALLEREPDALVQGVVLQDRHRVVVRDRPLDPVLLQQRRCRS